jgi:hypothetical protein
MCCSWRRPAGWISVGAAQRLDAMLGVVDQWRERVSGFDIRQLTAQVILRAAQRPA